MLKPDQFERRMYTTPNYHHSRTRHPHAALITTLSMRARVPSGQCDGKQGSPTPESRRTKAFLAHHQRADLEEGSVFVRRVGGCEAQSPGSSKSPVVLVESLAEPLGLCPAIVWGAAVEGREIVMLP